LSLWLKINLINYLCSLNNYRGITLTPVISKLFESILLNKCEEHLVTDELQFGFKKATGCPQAVFTLQSVVEYFNVRGSSVFAAMWMKQVATWGILPRRPGSTRPRVHEVPGPRQEVPKSLTSVVQLSANPNYLPADWA